MCDCIKQVDANIREKYGDPAAALEVIIVGSACAVYPNSPSPTTRKRRMDRSGSEKAYLPLSLISARSVG